MYKFINPGSAASTVTASNEAARTTLLATNRLGSSVSGLANTVNNLEKIYKASNGSAEVEATFFVITGW